MSGSRNTLTPEQIKEVKRLYASGMYQKDIAIKFGVSPSLISEVVNG